MYDKFENVKNIIQALFGLLSSYAYYQFLACWMITGNEEYWYDSNMIIISCFWDF